MTLASIIKQHQHEFLETYSDRLTPQMLRLMDAILVCRSERAGKSLPDHPHVSANFKYLLGIGAVFTITLPIKGINFLRLNRLLNLKQNSAKYLGRCPELIE